MKIVIEPVHFNRTLKRMTHEIIERNEDLNSVILVGIERKGTPIAREIATLIGAEAFSDHILPEVSHIQRPLNEQPLK